MSLHQTALAVGSSCSQSSSASSIEQLCDDPLVVSKVFDSLHSTGLQIGLKPKELPVHITLAPEEWTPSNNLLTAAFKLKRKVIYDTYRDKIAGMFNAIHIDAGC